MRRFSTILLLAVALSSCTANKFLPEGQKYFEGHERKYVGDQSVPYAVDAALLSDLKPEATRRIGISRPGAWLYGVMGEVEKEKGLRHFLKYKLGKKPTYTDAVNLDRNRDYLEYKLRAAGFFRAEVKAEFDTTANAAKALYLIDPKEPYRFDTLFICRDLMPLCDTLLAAHRFDPIIEYEQLFQSRTLEEARSSAAHYFNRRGYYYFRPEFTFFEADSNDASRMVDLRWNVRDNLPDMVTSVYTLGDVTLDFSAQSTDTETVGDSIKIVQGADRIHIKPEKILPFIAYNPGEIYNRRDEEITIKQLNRLEVFDYVNIRYNPDTAEGKRILHAELLASPRKKHSVRAEANVSTTSTNYTGPGLQLEYYNRNLFRGAEKFRFTATGRYETQLSGERKGQNSIDINLMATVHVPRVGLPFVRQSKDGNVPSTKYYLNYRLYHQPEYYSQSNFGAGFGYEWLDGEALHHNLTFMGLDYVRLLRTSDHLEQLFTTGILFRESFDDQLILGPTYDFTYAPAERPDRRWQFYVGGGIDISGNLLYGAMKLTDAKGDEDGKYNVAGVPFAQYVRLQNDFRAYYRIDKYNRIVLRQHIGLGVPYLNSSALPFAKQFFVGGTSSLRGFAPRALGPGSYTNPDSDFDTFFDRTGDILIEYNAEHRADMGKYLKGAIFLDAGNVWLQNAAQNRPGGVFRWKDFIGEMAMAGGVGLRIDAQFVIIRFDFAIPLREPYFPKGERWSFDRMSLPWVGDKLVLNIAIGYPF